MEQDAYDPYNCTSLSATRTALNEGRASPNPTNLPTSTQIATTEGDFAGCMVLETFLVTMVTGWSLLS